MSEDLELDSNDTGTDIVTRMISVHGMIVADDCFGDIYMVPLTTIMEDVKQALNATSVSLPRSVSDIKRMIQSGSFSLRGSVLSPESPTATDLEELADTSPTFTEAAQIFMASSPHPQTPMHAGPTHAGKRTGNVWCCCECGDRPLATGLITSCPMCDHRACSNCEHLKISTRR